MAAPLDLNNVQGDILPGLPKKTETFFFFRIDDARVQEFRKHLTKFVPLVTTTTQVMRDREMITRHKRSAAQKRLGAELLAVSGVNLAFTFKGLAKMNIRDEIGDPVFNAGMVADAKNLGDQGRTDSAGKFVPDWIDEFKQENEGIHGVILITGDCHATVEEKLTEIKEIFLVEDEQNATIHEVISVVGDVRPGEFSAHEHFGYRDGVSQPAVQDVDTNPNPGQETVPQGIILLGREGDQTNVPGLVARPWWAVDGSFLCFRYMFQHVPEFDAFLKRNALPIFPIDPSAPQDLGSELLGARLVGRWKSGAPVDIAPLRDDPALGADPSRNDDFQYAVEPLSQERCPFAAHTRKTNPRADITSEQARDRRRILRRGITFGPEVSVEEAESNTSDRDLARGLLFVSYQSSIVNGFKFIQQSWANNESFPSNKGVEKPGFDAIVGQTNEGGVREMTGTNPDDPSAALTLTEHWVKTRGGEYFFSPSIRALKETFALAA